MRRVLVVLVLLVVAVGLLVAAGVREEEEFPRRDINIASVFPAEGPVHELMVEFKRILEQETDGRMAVTIHPGGALGAEREVVESLVEGTVEMAAQGIMDLIMYLPEYTVFEEPYVIRDLEHLRRFWDTIGQEINEILEEETGIITCAIAVRGSRMITANVPIKEPEDLEGLRFRLPSYPVRIAVFEAFGATPTVVAFPELYMALRTGTVDAQENPPETIYTYKYFEAQDYLINTRHVWSTARYQIAGSWFDTLSEDEQRIILDAWQQAEEHIKEIAYDPDEIFVEKLMEEGMTFVEPNSEAFRELAEPVLQRFDEEQWDPGIRQRIMDL